MDELDKIFTNTLTMRHKKVAPGDINAYVQEETKGKYNTPDEVRLALNARDATPGIPEGIARAAAKGASLGLGRPVAAATDALMAGPDPRAELAAFKDTWNSERNASESFRHAHPVLSPVSELTGGLAPVVAAAPFAAAEAPLSALGNMIQGFKIGGTMGAVSGAANANSPADIPKDVVAGGGLGAVGGAAAAGATDLAMTAGSGIADLVRRALKPASWVAKHGDEVLAGELPVDAASRIAALEKTAPGEVTPADIAPNAIDQAVMHSPDVARTAQEQLAGRGDAAGERLAAQATRLSGIKETLHQAKTAADAAKEPLRAATYRPLEEQFPRGSIPIKVPEVKSISVSPEIPGYETPANMLEGAPAVAGEAAPKLPLTPLQEAMKNPTIKGVYQKFAPADGSNPGFRELQSTWRALQANGKAFFKEGGGMPVAGKYGDEWFNAADELKAAMEKSVPGFQEANKKWGLAMEARKQYKVNVLRMSPEELASTMAGLEQKNPAAAQALRVKGLDELTSKLKDLGSGSAERQALMRGNQNLESRLKTLFPSEDPAALAEYVQHARNTGVLRRTETIAEGSQTAQRGATGKRMFGEAPTANPPGFLAGIRQTLAKKMLGDQTEALAQHYGSRLLVRGKDVPPTIRAIDAVRQSLLKSQQTQQAFSTAAPALVVGQHRALWDLLTGSRR